MTKLEKVQSSLPNFYSYFKDINILAISEDKASLPFCFIIEDNKRLLLSPSVDYVNPLNIAEIAINCSRISKTYTTDPFYISMHSGVTLFGDEAYDRWSLDAINLEEEQPISEALN